jgi:hypothetical protein
MALLPIASRSGMVLDATFSSDEPIEIVASRSGGRLVKISLNSLDEPVTENFMSEGATTVTESALSRGISNVLHTLAALCFTMMDA